MTPNFSKGLIPAVAQDAETGEILMVAYMDQEAWDHTLATQRAWFHSRRRGLWQKGETSGAYLDVVEVKLDCDQDAVLLRVNPRGPTCHTGAQSCFSSPWTLDAD